MRVYENDTSYCVRFRLKKHIYDSLFFSMSKLKPGAAISVIYTECYSVRLLTVAITVRTVQM